MCEKNKWKSRFLVVALGQAISLLGSHGVQFALIWWLAEKTSSPLMLGMSGLVAYLPMTLFSPIAEKVGVNIWFLISGISIVLITEIILLCYKMKYGRRSV